MNRPARFHSTAGSSFKAPLLLLPLLLLAVCGTGCFRVSSDTRALRESVLENLEGFWEEKIEFSAGRFLFAAAQFGGRFVDIPPEARAILDSAKGVEISLWESRERQLFNPAKILGEADIKMEEQGWTRLVGVINDRDLVAVYTPEGNKNSANVRIAVLVVNRDQVVCASARSNLEPLLELALAKARENNRFAAALPVSTK